MDSWKPVPQMLVEALGAEEAARAQAAGGESIARAEGTQLEALVGSAPL